MERIREKENRLLVAVTGGIASGKSTVSRMLQDLGAVLIDLDVLARLVVEPGSPAWKEIVDYFGQETLLRDGRVDRKKISDIVFKDGEKRKALERFTHPRIFEEMQRQVEEAASENPDAVIAIGIPLLFELGLQREFQRVLVVYSPPGLQIKRLMERDRISREAAENILNSQMPIDDKVPLAHFVVYNEGTLSETRRQVEEIWGQLKTSR